MSIIINAKSGAKAVDAERVRSLVEAGKLKPEARVASIDDGKTWISVSDALAQHDKQDATQEPLPPTGAAVLKLKSTKGLIEISEEKVRSLVDTGKLAPDRKLLTKNDGADWISYNQLSGDEEGQVEVESEEGVATPPKANPAAGGRPIRGGRATPNAKQDASVITNERDFIATLFLSCWCRSLLSWSHTLWHSETYYIWRIWNMVAN